MGLLKNLKKEIESSGPVSVKEIIIYMFLLIVSLLTCYIIGTSMLVSGKPWDGQMTNNVLNWIQMIALFVIILQLERMRCCIEKAFKKR